MSESKFKVGDKVTIFMRSWDDGYGPCGIRTVTRTLVKYIELEDGSKWTYDGTKYPRGSSYNLPEIRALTKEHIDQIRHINLRHKIKKWAEKNLDKQIELTILEDINKQIELTILKEVQSLVKESENE